MFPSYFHIYICIYILRQSINGDDYLSGAAQREQTKKNYKKSADHINSDKIELYTKFISNSIIATHHCTEYHKPLLH